MVIVPTLDIDTWPEVRRLKSGVTFGWRYPRLHLRWLKENKGEEVALSIFKEAMAEIAKDYLLTSDDITFKKVQLQMGWQLWEEIIYSTMKMFDEATAVQMTRWVFIKMPEERFLKGLESFGLTGNDPITAISWHYFANKLCGKLPGELTIERDGRLAYVRYPRTPQGTCFEAPKGKVTPAICMEVANFYRRAGELFSAKTGKNIKGGLVEPIQLITKGDPCCKFGYWEVD